MGQFNKKMIENYFDYSAEVSKAMQMGQPLLALESTIITHGLPYPKNLETAMQMESICWSHDVCPATIAMVNGRVQIGLTEAQINFLSQENQSILKASSLDLPWLIANKLTASTTVAGTLKCAYLAGLKVFSTGGIGGVHRGFSQFYDVSRDIEELGKTPMIVVSAGAKAILDLPKTMEALETCGVLCVGWKTNQFPAFYYADSGLTLDYHTDSIDAICKMYNLLDSSSALILNPPPSDSGISKSDWEQYIENGCKHAAEENISGKRITPFLLDYIAKATSGGSINLNIGLIASNVKLGCHIAKSL